LEKKDALGVVDLLLEKVKEYLAPQKIEPVFTKSIKNMIFERGFSKKYGARPLQRVIDKDIIRGLAKKMLQDKIKPGTRIRVDFRNDKLSVREIKPRLAARKTKKTIVKA
jgi:ATP-dependent Clp protease ATP-binding subunit ClpC